MEVKSYIVIQADQLFCQYGFKSVTMDDIAKHLGMSKKTIYQHFKDKDELVNILMQNKLMHQDCAMDSCASSSANAVEEIFLAMDNIQDLLTNMNPKLFYDLQKYHPKAWLCFKEFKVQSIGKAISTNLDRGVSEGLYRADIQKEILTQMRIAQIDLIFTQHDNYTMGKFNIAQVMIEITTHFLHGICNTKGLQLINHYKNQPTQV